MEKRTKKVHRIIMNSAKTMVNVSPKMSNRVTSDKRELEKYVKMFSTKAVQAIVQSRLGDKIQTISNPRSLSNDWVSESDLYWFLSFFPYKFQILIHFYFIAKSNRGFDKFDQHNCIFRN